MEELKEMNSSVDGLQDTTYTEVKDPYGFIYITTNLIDGKRYLGQRKFYGNWQEYLGSGAAFKQAIDKYGKENFVRNVIDIAYSAEELNEMEYNYSVFFNAVESNNWYNLVYGGGTTQGWTPSKETRKKISKAAKERLSDPNNHPMYGRVGLVGENNPQFKVSPKERMDEETYKQWYEKHKLYWANPTTKGKHIWIGKQHPSLGKKLSDEQKLNLSEKAKERFINPSNHPMYGKHHTEEAKKKMSDSRKGSNWWKCRRIYCIELNQIFWGAKEVQNLYGFDPSSITKCCRGKQNYTYKHPQTGEALHWLYAEDAIEKGYITQEELDRYINSLKGKGD